jgi:hypothetical protein
MALGALAGLLIGVTPIASAKAQSGQAPTGQPQTPGPAIPEQIRPPVSPPGNAGGIVRPPSGIDPAMQVPVPAPPQSSMPVIQPPGTSGNSPGVQPK